MEPIKAELAPRACSGCARRKKACDRALPACSSCLAHGKPCTYEDKGRARPARPRYVGRQFVAVQTPPSSGEQSEDGPGTRLPEPSGTYRQSASRTRRRAIDEEFERQVYLILSASRITQEEVIHRYFQSFHLWLPIVSRDIFTETFAVQATAACPPPANHSLLVVAMAVVAVIPRYEAAKSSPDAQESLYLATKSFFSQAQAAIGSSISLVQAALIIAACEFACGQSETAYVSLKTCIGLAQILGLDGRAMLASEDEGWNIEDAGKTLERRCLAWGIAMIERVIISEIRRSDDAATTDHSTTGRRLPIYIQSAKHPNLNLKADFEIPKPNRPSGQYVASAAPFVWRAEAVYLLDQALGAIHTRVPCAQSRLAHLAALDVTLRDFLSSMVSEDKHAMKSVSILIALCLRSLFLIHGAILNEVERDVTGANDPMRTASGAALDMASEMVYDFATWQGHDNAEMMPSCSYYNLQAAIEHFQERLGSSNNCSLALKVDSLLQWEKKYQGRWANVMPTNAMPVFGGHVVAWR